MALSVFGMGQKTSYSIDFKQNSQELKLSENTTVLVFQKNNSQYNLITGEALGLPKKTDNVIVILDNLHDITFIQLEDENGAIYKIVSGANDPIKSEYKWAKLSYFNKEGKKVGEQNFNKIF